MEVQRMLVLQGPLECKFHLRVIRELGPPSPEPRVLAKGHFGRINFQTVPALQAKQLL